MSPACKYFMAIFQEFDESIARARTTLGQLSCLRLRTLPAVQDINVCRAILEGELQLCRIRYRVGADNRAGIKESGRHVGQTQMVAVVTELELIFHENLLTQNNCREPQMSS